MLKDIIPSEIKDIGIAIVKESSLENDWKVYLINLSDFRLDDVIINSTGIGLNELDESIQTGTFRHYIKTVKPRCATPFETIMEEIFLLSNRFWLSFYIDKKISDRKYEFVPGSISAEFFIPIPFTGKQGIMII